MQCRALHVAIAERVFFRLPARLADEGIVLGHPPVIVEADDRARMIVRPLRAVLLATFAERDVEITLTIEHQPRAEMAPRSALGLLAEDDLYVLETMAGEAAAGDFGADAAFATRGVGEIHKAVLRIAGMQGDIEQPTLTIGGYRWQAGHGIRIEPAVIADDPESARALRDQHSAIGQKGEPPRVLQSLDNLDHTDR